MWTARRSSSEFSGTRNMRRREARVFMRDVAAGIRQSYLKCVDGDRDRMSVFSAE